MRKSLFSCYAIIIRLFFTQLDKVAIKIVDRSRLDSKNLRMLSREVSTLESVQHPFIIRLFEVVETLGRVHLVTEYIQGGELYYKIVQNGVYTETKAAKIFKQLCLAIQHMVRWKRAIRDILLISRVHSIISATFIVTWKRRTYWWSRRST